jgi:2'-phosphotransferase
VRDLLNWHKMRKELNVAFEEVLEEVRMNEKGRFALLFVPPDARDGGVEGEGSGKVKVEEAAVASSEFAAASATANALDIAFSSPDPDPSHFLIRATQGHSIKTVTASAYLTPITLEDPSSIPETVVHGTFYAAWDAILRTSGLKPMSRVHVHFATGPSLHSVIDGSKEEGEAKKTVGILDEERAVISGMRNDAQILIYLNVRKALDMGIPFWMSENGVVLSEGVEGVAKGKDKRMRVPIECWDVVVEVKEGLGVLWLDGKVIKELPEHLKRMGWPHRKGKKGSGAGGQKNDMNSAPKKPKAKNSPGDKPRLMVERDDLV